MSEENPNEPANGEENANKSSNREIKTDEILDRIKPEPGLIRVAGRFLGHSDRADYYRLYINDRLDRYLEFPKDATLEAERFPSGRLVVWLKPGTRVTDTTTGIVPENLLTGRILRQYARGATGLAGTRRMALDMASDSGCCGPSAIANCPDTQTSFTCDPRDPDPNCPYNQF